MSWFFLALLAPILYAIVNLIDDNLLRFVYKSPRFAAAVSGLFGALPLLSLVVGDWAPISWTLALIMVGAGFLTTAYYFYYFRALKVESPSVVVAMFCLAPAALPILAFYFLGERLEAIQLVGFLIVLLASFGLALTDVRKFKLSKGLMPALAVVVLVDIIAILTKYVFDRANFYPAFMMFSLGIGLGGVCYLLGTMYGRTKYDFSGIKKQVKTFLPLLVLVELLGVAAEFTTSLAVSRGPVSLVNVLEGTQPIFILVLALLFYPFAPKYFREVSEGNLRKKFLLMSIILLGVFLVGSAV